MSIVTVVGNPRPGSRTFGVATALTAALVARAASGSGAEGPVLDLATFGGQWLGSLDGDGEEALAAAAGASVLVVATPTYKASYTGLLKAFLDRLPGGALRRTVAVPVTIAAAPTHRFVADLQLRPVLAELGASLPVPSFVVEERELPDLLPLAERWATDHGPVLAATVGALAPAA
jgi:FMN reductase